MKLELKNIKYSVVDDGSPLTAEIYIDSVYVGRLVDHNRPGRNVTFPAEFQAINKESADIMVRADEYFKTRPPITFPSRFGQEEVVWESNLVNKIKEIFVNYFDKKDAERFKETVDKQQYNGIVIGNRHEGSVTIQTSLPIPILLMGEPGTMYLQQQLQMIREHITKLNAKGQLILNTNIPENILKNAGYQPEEYAKPDLAMHWLEERKIATVREKLKPRSNGNKRKRGKRM